MCVSDSLPPGTNYSFSGNLANRKVGASDGPQALAPGVICTEKSKFNTSRSGEAENSSEVHSNSVFVPSELNKHYMGGSSETVFMGNDQGTVAPSVSTSFLELSKPHDFKIGKAVTLNSNGDVQDLCSGLSSVSMHGHHEDSYFTPDSDRLLFTHNSINSSKGQDLLQDNEYSEEHSTTPALWEDIIVDDMLNIDYERPKFDNASNNLSSGFCSPSPPQNVDQSSHQLWQQDQLCHQNHLGKPDKSFNEPLQTGSGEHVECKDNGTGADSKVGSDSSDMEESSIISNILSLELDALEDSLVKLLGESDEPCIPIKSPTLRKVQDKKQSMFSFARQDGFMNEESDFEQSFGIGHAQTGNFALGGLIGSKGTLNGNYPHVSPSSNSALSDKFVGSQSYVPSKFSMPKAHASSPPGFAMSSRIPPGFSCGRMEQDCNSSVKHFEQQYVATSGNIGLMRDVEFNDPAILKVMLAERLNNASFDMRQSLLPQFRASEDDTRLKLFMQQSIPLQDLMLPIPDHVGNRFSPQNDAYRISSRFLDQFQPNNASYYEQLHSQQISSQWGARNDAMNFSGLSMSEVLNNEKLGFSNFMPSYENIKF